MNKKKIVALISTCPRTSKGSMARYANLVEVSLCSEGMKVLHINLALPGYIIGLIPSKFRVVFHHLWILIMAPFRLCCINTDLFHILDGSHAYVGYFVPSKRLVVTSHDIIPFLLSIRQLKGGKPGWFGRMIIQKSIQVMEQAEAVICVSNNTLNDLLKHTQIEKTRLSVINPALSYLSKIQPFTFQERLNRTCPYVFHIGHNGYYKNREAVLRIFAGILIKSPKMKLKMAGPRPSNEVSEVAQQLGIMDKVDFIVNPDDETVAKLYAGSCLFLFPSRYEGFGWPPLEAMAYRCPVICSSAGSLQEVVGKGAIIEDVENEEAIIAHSIELLSDYSKAEEQIERGSERIKHFKLKPMAMAIINIYRKIII